MAAQANNSAMNVRHFRQILLWPLQLMPIRPGTQIQEHWEVLDQETADNPWRELLDEFTPDGKQFQLRHYSEFVTFLPYVQRFLYGESRAKKERQTRTRSRAARRCACSGATTSRQCAWSRAPATEPIVLPIAHIDLYFFYDIDVVLLNVEVYGDDLTLPQAQELLYRFGRAYPAGWDERGDGLHCLHACEWLARGRHGAGAVGFGRSRQVLVVCLPSIARRASARTGRSC